MPEIGNAIRLRGFRGLNLVESPDFMDPRQTPDAQNVHTDGGIIRKRPALTPHYTTELSGEAADEPGGSWWFHTTGRTGGNSVYMLVQRGGSTSATPAAGKTILVGDAMNLGTAWDTISTWASGYNDQYARIPPCNFQDLTVLSAYGNSYLYKYTAAGAHALLGAYPASQNDGAAMCEYNNMLFRWSTGTIGGLLNYSGINNCESWASTDALTVGSDQGLGAFLARNGDYIVAGKSSGIYAVRGYGRASLRVDNITRAHGTRLTGNAAETPWGVVYTSAPANPIMYSVSKQLHYSVRVITPGGSDREISRDIAGGSLFGENAYGANAAFGATGHFHYDGANDRLFFIPFRANAEVPYAGGTPTIAASGGQECWVFQDGNWHKWNFIHDTTNSRSFQLSFIGGSYDGKVLAVGGGFSGYRYINRFDDDVAMDTNGTYACTSTTYSTLQSYWATPYLMYSSSDRNDETQCLYIYGKTDTTFANGGGIEIWYRADDSTAWTRITYGATGSTFWPLAEEGVRCDVHITCRRIQFKFVFTDASADAEIQGVDLCFRELGRG